MERQLLNYANHNLENADIDTLYNAVLKVTQDKIADMKHVTGERKVYYMSAEFLIGKLLSNNMMNLGIYDEVKDILAKYGHDIKDI